MEYVKKVQSKSESNISMNQERRESCTKKVQPKTAINISMDQERIANKGNSLGIGKDISQSQSQR